MRYIALDKGQPMKCTLTKEYRLVVGELDRSHHYGDGVDDDFARYERMRTAILGNEKALALIMEWIVVSMEESLDFSEDVYGTRDHEFHNVLLQVKELFTPEDRKYLEEMAELDGKLWSESDKREYLEELRSSGDIDNHDVDDIDTYKYDAETEYYPLYECFDLELVGISIKTGKHRSRDVKPKRGPMHTWMHHSEIREFFGEEE